MTEDEKRQIQSVIESVYQSMRTRAENKYTDHIDVISELYELQDFVQDFGVDSDGNLITP